MKFAPIACALSLALCATAHAAPVTFEYTAQIETSTFPGVDVDATVSGTMTWDTDLLPDSGPVSLAPGTRFASYLIDRPDAFTMSVAGGEFKATQMMAVVLDSDAPAYGAEGLSIIVNAASLNGEPLETGFFQFTLQTPGTTETLTIGLPDAVTFDDFLAEELMPSGYFATSSAYDALTFHYKLTSFKPQTTAVEVPEASTAMSMSLGMLALAGLAGYKRRKTAGR